MSYEMKASPSLDCGLAHRLPSSSYLHSSSHSSAFRNTLSYPPIYSQCGDLFTSVKFLSQSLKRMRVDHAITGYSAAVMESGITISGLESEIELVLSSESYEDFLKRCVYQQMTPIEGEARAFWDHRTGSTVRIYLSGERIKVGRRSVEIPDLSQTILNDEGIKAWKLDLPVARKSMRKAKLTPIAA